MDLFDILKTCHANAEEYTFSSAHGTFSRIDHTLATNQTSVNLRKLKSSIFSNHNNAMRLGINYKKKL